MNIFLIFQLSTDQILHNLVRIFKDIEYPENQQKQRFSSMHTQEEIPLEQHMVEIPRDTLIPQQHLKLSSLVEYLRRASYGGSSSYAYFAPRQIMEYEHMLNKALTCCDTLYY